MTSIDHEAQKMADDLAAKSPTNTSVDGEAAKLADLYKPHLSAETFADKQAKQMQQDISAASPGNTSIDKEAQAFAESIKPENKVTLPPGKYYTNVDREAEKLHGNKRG